jgi:glycosyltransferase involved in cell wall biosynthesis
MSDASARAAAMNGAGHVLEVNNLAEWFSSEFGGWKRLIQWPLIRSIERRVTHAADLCIAISEPVAAALERIGVPRSKILVQFNGVDPDRFPADLSGEDVRRQYSLGDAPVAGFVGTFGDWHGAENLVRAIPLILNRTPRAKFLFVGDGVRRSAAEDLARSLGVAHATVFTGLVPQEQAPPYLAACDVLVSPHSWMRNDPFIGSPTKVFEYMAAARGIVASRLGQIADVLKDEETALLVPPDHIDALAKSVTRLLESPDLARSMGARARATALAKHTWDSNVRQMLSWLQEREKI